MEDSAADQGRVRGSAEASDSGPVVGAPTHRPSVREAMLKPEFADKYVGVQPGVWCSAAGLAEQLITRLLREGIPDEELPQRVLDPAHFEFRGGESSSRSASAR